MQYAVKKSNPDAKKVHVHKAHLKSHRRTIAIWGLGLVATIFSATSCSPEFNADNRNSYNGITNVERQKYVIEIDSLTRRIPADSMVPYLYDKYISSSHQGDGMTQEEIKAAKEVYDKSGGLAEYHKQDKIRNNSSRRGMLKYALENGMSTELSAWGKFLAVLQTIGAVMIGLAAGAALFLGIVKAGG